MAPFEMHRIKSRHVVENGDAKFVKETEWGGKIFMGSGSVPIMQVTRERLPDPLDLYSKILDMGKEYGLVKLVVLEEAEKAFSSILALHADTVWFRSRVQFFKSFKNQRRKVLWFHKQLYSCHNSVGHGISKVPSIDKRTLDLYRLWRCVQLRGGYKQVCQKKLWAQIGRELGYSGKIMSSLSTSLRSAYVKVLLDLELDPNFSADTDDLNLSSSNEKEKDGIFKIINSNPDIKLLRDLKKFKGFKSNFDGGLDIRKNVDPKSLLPGYDLTNWLNSVEIFDNPNHETKFSPMYNLRQYYEKSIEHDEKLCPSKGDQIIFSDFENWYWQTLSSKNTIDVDASFDLASVKHNFGLLTSLPSLERPKIFQDNWQLNSLPLHKDSLLRFLNLDFGEFTHSHIDVGMLFSTKSWSMEPLGLPSLSYNHLGSTKIWYAIPPNQWTKFQNLLEELNMSGNDNDLNDSNEDLSNETFRFSEFCKSFLETNNNLNREKKLDIHDIIDREPVKDEAITNGIFITPDVLMKYGIKCNKITQESGSYIFKFPLTHTCNIDSGFCLSENSNFAPLSWLDDNWFGKIENDQKFSPLPRINPFQFLMSVVLNSNDPVAVKKCQKLLKNPIEEELLNRQLVKKCISQTQIVENRFDYISDFSLQPLGASKIVLCSDSDCVSLSIEEFLSLSKQSGEFKEIFNLTIDGRILQAQLHLYYDDSILEQVIEKTKHVQKKLFKLEDLDRLVNHIYPNRRIGIDLVNQLLSKSAGDGVVPFVEVIKRAKLLQIECQTLLEKVALELINPSSIAIDPGEDLNLIDLQNQCDKFYDLKTLEKLKSEVNQCSIEFPEMLSFFRLCEEVDQIQLEAQTAIQNKDKETLKKCFALNCSLGVKNDLIAHNIGQLSWLQVYQNVFENSRTSNFRENSNDYSLESMSWFLIFGTKYCSPEDLDKLHKVRAKILKTQNLMSKLNELFRNRKPRFKISVEDLVSLWADIESERLPIDPETLKLLRSIVSGIGQIKEKMVPIWNSLSVNEQFVEELKSYIKMESTKSFELFPRFNGGSKDERIHFKDANEDKIFIQERKACKLWLADLSRLSTKSGIDKIRRRIAHCLDLKTDTIEASDYSSKLYCFCREGDTGGTMVECEICKEWYHTKCLKKGNWKLPNESVFICSVCSPEATTQDEYINTIDYNNVADLILESLDLKLLPDRNMVSDLFTIYSYMMTFKKKMEQELFRDNGTVLGPDVPLYKIKFFLRKAHGAKCNFGDINNVIKDYCRSQDEGPINRMKQSGQIVITGPSQRVKQEQSLGPSLTSLTDNHNKNDSSNGKKDETVNFKSE